MKTQLLCLLSVFLLSGFTAWGQVDKATVTGTLTDPSGATIPDAKVTVAYPATGLNRSAMTNGSGLFLIVGLPVGHVVVDVVKDGFRPVHTETDLDVGQTKTLDFPLEIA